MFLKRTEKEYLNTLGKDVNFFPGVTEWFDRINEYGKSLGVEIEHYIISSGLKEIIEGKHDDLPESAFLFVGTIDEVVAKAKGGK